MATPQPNSSRGPRARRCQTVGCNKHRVAGPEPHCRRHGGGFPCQHPGCPLSGVGGGEHPHRLCYGHGGGKLCNTEGCTTPARKDGLCKLHGGGRRCSRELCNDLAQSGGQLCNKHGGGYHCEIPNCTTNTYRNRRCKRHRDTLMPEPEPDSETESDPAPEPDAESDVDYVEGFVIVSHVIEAPVPQSSIIENPDWTAIRNMLERAQHRQPTARLCITTGCTRPAATTEAFVDSPSELVLTLGGRCKECTFFTKEWTSQPPSDR